MAEILNLNTRLGLKIDTLENWSKAENQFKLLNGEVAIATVAATAGNGLAEPVTMIKIGDGTKTFNELPWAFYAKAADVYGWAKKEHPDWADFSVIPEDKLPTAGIDTDTKYAFEITTEGKLKVTSTTYTKGVAGATTEVGQYDFVTPAELETALANYYTKGEVDGLLAGYAPLAAFNELKDKVEDEDGALAKANAAYALAEQKVDTNDFNNFKTENTKAIADAQKAGTDAAAQAFEDAKKYADDNDADTQYGIEYDPVAKKIKLVSDTSKTEIDATDFIKDGMIESVVLSEDGLNLVITWNTDADKGENNVTTIPLAGLVDVYTGVDGTTVKVEVSSENKISAEVKDGTITKAKLDTTVQASLGLADSAIQESDLNTTLGKYYTKTEADAAFTDSTEVDNQINAKITALDLANTYEAKGAAEALANGAVKANTEAIATINDTENGILAKAMKYADDNDADTTYTAKANGGLKLEGTEFRIDETMTFIFNCGSATTVLDAPNA